MSSVRASCRKPDTLGHRQRLRRRLLAAGADALADYELLEMVLFSAMPRGDVKPLAKRLIGEFGDFANVTAAPERKLREIDGMGDAAIAAVKVIEGAAQRLARSRIVDKPVLSNWSRVVDYCQSRLGRANQEHFRVLFLNSKNVLIADEEQQRGTIDRAPVYPREVVKRALELDASAIILLHNHPSGDPTPSPEDINMTHEIRDIAAGLDIRLHDHVIVSSGGHRSFKEQGLL